MSPAKTTRCSGKCDDDVAVGVGRADVDELDRRAVQIDLEAVVEEDGRRRELDSGEVPRLQCALEPGEARLARDVHALDGLEDGRVLLGERFGAAAVADELGLGEELIAPAVVAVVVGVDDASRRRVPDPRVAFDHLAGVRQVPEGVDDEAAAAVDEAGVAAAEARAPAGGRRIRAAQSLRVSWHLPAPFARTASCLSSVASLSIIGSLCRRTPAGFEAQGEGRK